MWVFDYNGDRQYRPQDDRAFIFGGWDSSRPVVGDWNGDGRDSAGVYRRGSWYLDYDGDRRFERYIEDRIVDAYWTHEAVVPFVGDWNGDGRSKTGAYFDGRVALDFDGDGRFRGTGERPFFLGNENATVVVGDWNASGADSVAAVEQGLWAIDRDGNQIHNGNDPMYPWGDEWVSEPSDRRVYVPGKWKPAGPAR